MNESPVNEVPSRRAGKPASVWWRALRRVARLISNRVVGDRPHGTKPPAANYIPNSNGEGGRVIASGHPGGGH